MCSSESRSGPRESPLPPGGDSVQYSSVLEIVHPPQAERKPRLVSFDSGQEFSLENYLAVYKLVEKEDLEGYVFDESCLGIPK